jgi:hypothetical protein
MQQKHYNDHGGFWNRSYYVTFILNKKWIPFFLLFLCKVLEL